jgi:hypothetical protein
MKACLILFLILLFLVGCDQKKQETQKSVYDAVWRIVYLHEQAYRARELYTYSQDWVYRHGGSDGEALRNAVFFNAMAMRESNVKTAAYDSIKNGVARLSRLAEQTMERLRKYEDYYDAGDNESQAFIQGKARLDKEMTSQLQSVRTAIQQQLAAEKQTLDALLASNTLSEKKITAVNAGLQSVEAIAQTREINLDIYAGAMSWIYRPHDTASKAKLTQDLATPLMLAGKKIPGDTSATTVAQIEELLTAVRAACKEGIITLTTDQDYEDPTKVFLAENVIESELAPNATGVSHFATPLFRDRVEQLMMTLADDQALKEADIRRLLRKQVSIHRFVENHRSKYPDLKQDELVDVIVPLYAERFSHEEIKEIIRFQESTAGKKMEQYSGELQAETKQTMERYLEKLPLGRQ